MAEMSKSKSRIRFTGMDYGLLVRMDWEVPLSQLLVEIEEHIQKSPGFFADAKVFLEVDTRPVLQQETQQLGVVLARHGLDPARGCLRRQQGRRAEQAPGRTAGCA